MATENNIPPMDDASNRKQLTDELLHAYLAGQLPPAKQHEVELWLADEGMESDAIEGLKQLTTEETKKSVARLNHNLRKATAPKKRRKNDAKVPLNALVAVITILLLVIVAYLIIRLCMP